MGVAAIEENVQPWIARVVQRGIAEETIRKGMRVNFEAMANRMAAEVNKLKSKWLDACMQRLVPPEINIGAHSNKGRERMKVQRYLIQQKIRLAESPDKTQITVDGTPVAEFAVSFKDGKFVVTNQTLPPDRKDN